MFTTTLNGLAVDAIPWAGLISTKDISEPTFLLLANDLDFAISTEIVGGTCNLVGVPKSGQPARTFSVGFDAISVSSRIASTTLAPGQYSQVAMLGENGATNLNFTGFDEVGNTLEVGTLGTELRTSQIDGLTGTVTVVPAATQCLRSSTRGVYADFNLNAWQLGDRQCTLPALCIRDLINKYQAYNPLAPLPLTTLTF